MTRPEPTPVDRPPRGRRRLPQILASAAAGCAEKGYDGASVADLTAWTGLGRGALYRQIGSKPDLLRAIAERYVAAVEEAVAGLDFDRDALYLRGIRASGDPCLGPAPASVRLEGEVGLVMRRSRSAASFAG